MDCKNKHLLLRQCLPFLKRHSHCHRKKRWRFPRLLYCWLLEYVLTQPQYPNESGDESQSRLPLVVTSSLHICIKLISSTLSHHQQSLIGIEWLAKCCQCERRLTLSSTQVNEIMVPLLLGLKNKHERKVMKPPQHITGSEMIEEETWEMGRQWTRFYLHVEAVKIYMDLLSEVFCVVRFFL